MPILGRKPVPEEEPTKSQSSSNWKSIMRWMIKELTLKSFSLSMIKDDVTTSDSKTEGNDKNPGWSSIIGRIKSKNLPSDQEIQSGNFSYKQIKAATKNFSPANKIGQGGFGSVYKGLLCDETAIAVKRLSKDSTQGRLGFAIEIKVLSKLRHPNVVTLFGHCVAEGNKFLLVYEYLANGSLLDALFGSSSTYLKERLNWETRLKICIGIAKGLAFSHGKFCVHRDIKLANILLDEHLNPKISDYGLARQLNNREGTHTLVAGTIGYMAPEYIMTGRLTEKADVYSFGVLVLELMSGRRCVDRSKDPQWLLEFAKDLKKKKNLISLLDQDLPNVSVDEATMVLELATLCTSFLPEKRPNMSDVVRILQGKNVLDTPVVLLESGDFARAPSNEMNLSDSSDKYLDSKDYSRSSLICTNAPTSETPILNAKVSSTSSTYEDITYVGDEPELGYVEPHFEEGTYHIECSNEEFEVGCHKWKNSLVGYFFSENGAFEVDIEMVDQILVPQQATGNVSVFSLGNGHFLFQFGCVEDKIKILESSGLLHIDGWIMRGFTYRYTPVNRC
ncbi:hypothetical protein MKW92_028976 [Papaver armeniacum]|nr:hypothetical protein MKW92_028976 [Papaver armeniacum]